MKILSLSVLALACAVQVANAQNTLTKKQQKQGWQLLFDGQSTKGWHAYLKPEPSSAWHVDNGVLRLDPKDHTASDLVTDKEYENFDLQLEWKIAEGGNSGIIFGIHEDPSFKNTYETGVEMQVLDNIKASDNKKENHLAGSLYDMKAPSKSVAKPAGEWNVARILKKDGHLTFFLNGTKIVETQMGSPEWQEMINASKFKTWKGFAAYQKGHISLQGHGADVQYRNIMIKEL